MMMYILFEYWRHPSHYGEICMALSLNAMYQSDVS